MLVLRVAFYICLVRNVAETNDVQNYEKDLIVGAACCSV